MTAAPRIYKDRVVLITGGTRGLGLGTALVFAAMTLVVLFPFAYVAGGVRLDPDQWVTLAYRVLLGSIPFIALGFAIGCVLMREKLDNTFR